jgi:ATP-dependent DNA ligase
MHLQRTTRKRVAPTFIEPMQGKPVAALPAGEKWVFELKLDGYRCIAAKRGQEVTLISRYKKVLTKAVPKCGRGARIARKRKHNIDISDCLYTKALLS